jgi:putative ABC transport system permease protein
MLADLHSAIRSLLESPQFGVTPTDPIAIAGAAALVIVVAFAACCVPARRAMRVDPIVALRRDS